ncbi:hypothetical protein [Rhizobium sp. Root1220]|uniref:hypothetical protein n=1 Tax=Rhizobium sp. Root1220 TaxID=1736432 RepID=UPI0006FAAD2F|nr:hypothetical protein [Rhizobium sp. Root1220]KQV83285.1 hypothetical protein ASC90_22105 [Rhizobium sp. Root1220]
MSEELKEVAKSLLERWDEFEASYGNQEEAYYKLAKYARNDWERLRTALTTPTEGVTPNEPPAPVLDEVVKLREALEDLLALNDSHSPFLGEIGRDRIDRAWDTARAALLDRKEGGSK